MIDGNPILKIKEDGYIQTLDKYGKATVVIEENTSLENQVVMLNIMISQVYSLSIEKPYEALNLPMGSETNLKVTLQEENARSFADKIEGVDLFIENSHPHIVEATLDKYNSTLSLNALGIGEANVRIFTKDNIFDVIRVKVQSSILPPSPVQLHVGGEVHFIFADDENPVSTKWDTKDTNILSVDSIHGTSIGLKEGTANVNIYKNIYSISGASSDSYSSDSSLNTVSLVAKVDVKKVDRIELDQSTVPEFFTNVRSNKYYQDEYRIKLNMFLEDGLTEITPEVVYKGKTLIKQNVKLTCDTEQNQFAVVFISDSHTDSRAKMSYMNWLIIRPRQEDSQVSSIPNTLKVKCIATSNQPSSYKHEEIFEIPFVSYFYINHPSRELNFYQDERFKSVPITSNSNFDVHVEANSDLINYKVDQKYANQNSYELQFSVPAGVKNEFRELKVTVTNPLAEQSETFLLSFYKNPKSHYSHSQVGITSRVDAEPVVDHKPSDDQFSDQAVSIAASFIIILILAIVVLVVIIYFVFCSKPENQVYDLDSSGLDSSSQERLRGFNSRSKKGQPIRSRMRYHYRD